MLDAFLHTLDNLADTCPKPCASLDAEAAKQKPQRLQKTKERFCHTAKPGSDCYKEVNWLKTEGIKQYPAWFPSLSQESTFEEVQSFLHGLAPVLQVCFARPCEEGEPGFVAETDSVRQKAANEAVEKLEQPNPSDEKPAEEEAGLRLRFRVRTAAKYLIDAVCYPILLTSSRSIILRADPCNTWERGCFWCSREGVLSLFRGMPCSLASAGCDEAMDMALSTCLDRVAAGGTLEITDRWMLGATAQSVLSFFTAPINMVGVIQRCQSGLIPGLPQPRDLWETVKGLPWWSFCYQLVMFSGFLALQIRLVQMKMEEGLLDKDEDREDREE